MNWPAIHAWCELIMGGSIAVAAFLLWRTTRHLVRMFRPMVIAITDLRELINEQKRLTEVAPLGGTSIGSGQTIARDQARAAKANP